MSKRYNLADAGAMLEAGTAVWYISFCDPAKAHLGPQVPGGPSFLGAAIVTGGPDVAGALAKAWRLGINPGGEAALFPVPLDAVDPKYLDTFIPRERMAELEADCERYGRSLPDHEE